ncbi:hypothetical protein [Pseudoduganella sp.]|uniref:hypothetical protein n=1 Tax=Pseudoduganella sp. TaxID=1880898 RepID=UPI0035B2FC8F
MNQVQQPTIESSAGTDKLALAKQLAASVARGTGAGLLRAALAVLAALAVNALGVAVFVDTSLGQRQGAAMPMLALVALPFVIAVALTAILSYKLGLQGVLARVVESQSELIARAGSGILEGFLRAVNYQPGGNLTARFIEQWQNYLQLQARLPKPLPWLMGAVTSRIPLAETITDVARPGMSLREIAHAAMTRTLQEAAADGLYPSYQAVLIALAAQFGMWYPISLLARHWLG